MLDARDISSTPTEVRAAASLACSCMFTIALSSWFAIRPNIPTPSASWTRLTLEKLRIFVWTLLCPELMLLWALQQWFAGRVIEDWAGVQGWTTAHNQFIQMGGFLLYKDGTPSQALCIKRLPKLVEAGAVDLPTTRPAEIYGRSKTSPFLATIALLQAGWFLIQCCARLANKLPLTPLEFETFIILVMNTTLLAIWWNKPLDVLTPIRVELKFEIPREEVEGPSDEDPEFNREKRLHKKIKQAFKAQDMLTTRSSPSDSPLIRLVTFLFIRPALSVSVGIMGEIVKLFDGNGVPEGNLNVPVYYVSPAVDGDDADTLCFLIAVVVGAVFHGFHCLLWRSAFPTPSEVMVWRICSLVTTSLPGVVLLIFFVVVGLVIFVSDTIMDGIPRSILGFGAALLVLLLWIQAVARLSLLVEAFISLRSMTPRMLEAVPWTIYIPHF